MKRKTSENPSRIYTYGALPPTVNADLVDEQMRRARIYQNKLTEIEIARRARMREIESSVGDVAALEEKLLLARLELDVARGEIKAARKAARRRIEMRAEAERATAAKAKIVALIADLKATRARLRENPDIKAARDKVEEDASEAIRQARAICGVYWGTYLLCEKAAQAARRTPDGPQFRRWNGRGRIGVQLQGGMPVAELFGDDTRIQVVPVPEEAWYGNRGLRRKLTRTKVRIRIGSEKRDPVWAEFPIVVHRPLPDDGVIKEAWVRREPLGLRMRWEFQIVVEAPSFKSPAVPVGRGTAALDLGWRLIGDGLRVAYLVDSDGRSEDIRLPPEIADKLAHAESLRAIRDRNLDAIKARILEWMATGVEVPSWLRDDAPEGMGLGRLAKWRSTARLRRVIWTWKDRRFPGDAEIFPLLYARYDHDAQTGIAWYGQDRHLYEWEANERDKVLARRREIYSQIATRLARTYSRIFIEYFKLNRVARRAKPEQQDGDGPRAPRRNRTIAAPSEFRTALKVACAATGAAVLPVPAQRTTLDCHLCGHQENWDTAALIHHVCAGCSALWDQDRNAAVNLRRRGEQLYGAGSQGDRSHDPPPTEEPDGGGLEGGAHGRAEEDRSRA